MTRTVLLIGNYAGDKQESMQRFVNVMLHGLTAAGITARVVEPAPLLGTFRQAGPLISKWLGYVDKFIRFPHMLRQEMANGPAVVHICDHSNAMYAAHIDKAPVVITCHDLLAVRGGLGEATDCPPSLTGRLLQRWILRWLKRADAIACVSTATLEDARRLLCNAATPERPRLSVILNGLNHTYGRISHAAAMERLRGIEDLHADKPFLLHVGSNLARKNREGVLRIFARSSNAFRGQLVFAGEPLSDRLHSLGAELGVSARIVQIAHPENLLLEALYNRAHALIYPSRFEGFGWPIIEAQACGCPVICSDSGPLPEVAGDAGLLHNVEDEEGFVGDIVRLDDPAEWQQWSERSMSNARRFDTSRMINGYIDLYRRMAPQL